MYNKTDDYYVVIEDQMATSDITIKDETKSNGDVSFLTFEACIQSFGARNRNRRLWKSEYVKQGLEKDEIILEYLANGGVPGESGHPVPDVGSATIERIVTIDPNNVSHVFKRFWWSADSKKLFAEVNTIDDGPGGKGYLFSRHILQKLPISFSSRAIIPQKKNPDGSTDQTGVGRIVTFDRVFGPSHKEAFKTEAPVKNVKMSNNLETVSMEACLDYIFSKSDKVKNILDKEEPVLESTIVTPTADIIVSLENSNDKIIITPEEDVRRNIKNFMRNRF